MGKDMKSMDDKPIHNINTGKSFSKIQDAIDDEETIKGHTIRVDPGTYEENVKVNKELTIESASGPEYTTVKAVNPRDHVFEVSADNATIKGFTISGAAKDGKAGIYLKGVERCTISNNVCNKNYNGIALQHSSHNTISNNICNENEVGIELYSANYNNISNNTCNENSYGISVSEGNNNTIARNTCNENRDGIVLYDASYNEISTNICNQNEGSGIVLVGCGIVLGLVSSNANRGNTISNNTCNGNWYCGIKLTRKGNENNTISNNTCNGSKHGIHLDSFEDEHYNNISNNTCGGNNYKDDLKHLSEKTIPPTAKFYLLSRLEAEIWGELKKQIHSEIVNVTPEEYAESRYKDFEEFAEEQEYLHERHPTRKEIINNYIENYNRKVEQRKQVAKLHRLQLARLKKLRELGLDARMTKKRSDILKKEIKKRVLELLTEGKGEEEEWIECEPPSRSWDSSRKKFKSVKLSEETSVIDNLRKLYGLYEDEWGEGFYYGILPTTNWLIEEEEEDMPPDIESKYDCAEYCDRRDSDTVNIIHEVSGTINNLCKLYKLELKEIDRLNKDELSKMDIELEELCKQKMEHIALLIRALQKLDDAGVLTVWCTKDYRYR